MSDVEIETNPIDRAVAHLLFHRPMELTMKHPAGSPNSSLSAKLLPTSENKVSTAANLPSGGTLPKGSEHESHHRPKSHTTHHQKEGQQMDLLTTSTSENTSTSMVVVGGAPHGDVTMELEASQ